MTFGWIEASKIVPAFDGDEPGPEAAMSVTDKVAGWIFNSLVRSVTTIRQKNGNNRYIFGHRVQRQRQYSTVGHRVIRIQVTLSCSHLLLSCGADQVHVVTPL